MSADQIILSSRPAIEGLCFRSIREQDADALYAIHAARLARDGVDPLSNHEDLPSRESLSAELSEAIAAGQQDRWLVAQVHDRVVGYSQMESWPEEDGTWVYLIMGWTLPEWRGQGIGTAMLHWCEATARRQAAEMHPGEKFEFAANASSTEHDTTALLVHEGYSAPYTVLEMGWDTSVPLPAPLLPPGIEVRPVRPEHYPLIAASVDEAYRHEYEDNRFQETFDQAGYAARLGNPRHDPTLWQVAWNSDQIVGQVLSVIQNGQGEVFEVSVRPPWRRQKIARTLVTRALQEMRARGIEVVRLYTVAEFRTRASDLYRSVGFRVLKEFPRYRKPSS